MTSPHIPPPELEDELARVVSRGRRRKAQRTGMMAGALALVVLLGAVGILARPGDDGDEVKIADDRTTTTVDDGITDPTQVTQPGIGGTTTTIADKPAKPVAPRPDFAVAVHELQEGKTELVVLDGATGKKRRTIYETQVGIHGVELSPDRKHVYFTTESCGFGVIERVRVDGPATQTPEQITKMASTDPAVSPDGKTLAYIGYQGGCEGGEAPSEWGVRVRDLASGADRWVAKGTEGWQMRSLTWSPDGKTLAVAQDRFSQSEPGSETRAESFVAFLDPGKEQDPQKARRLTSKRSGFGFLDPTYLADGTLFVVETPLGGKREAALLLVVDARSGATLGRVATGDPARAYSSTAADASGKHLLYLSAPGGDGRRGGELRVSSNGERTTVLAENVLSADW